MKKFKNRLEAMNFISTYLNKQINETDDLVKYEISISKDMLVLKATIWDIEMGDVDTNTIPLVIDYNKISKQETTRKLCEWLIDPICCGYDEHKHQVERGYA